MNSEKPLVVVICGATATGKSRFAFEWAQKLKTEIISFDSVQVYKRLDIGAAKPPLEMRNAVKHHLIDMIEPDQEYTAGDFRRDALEILRTAFVKHKVVILAGGTGFYLQALLKGMHEVEPVNPEIKKQLLQELSEKGQSFLYEELKGADVAYAESIHPNDQYRILRGLELIRGGKGKPSEIRERFKAEDFPYDVMQIGLKVPKEDLLGRVEGRTQVMMTMGLVDEAHELLKKYKPMPRVLGSVGYREAVSFIKGELPMLELAPAIVKSTMALAKRQNTWFKRDQTIKWLHPENEPDGAGRLFEKILQKIDGSHSS